MDYPCDKPAPLEPPPKPGILSSDANQLRGALWLLPWLGLAALFLIWNFSLSPCMRKWGPDTWGALFVYAAAGPMFAQFGVLPAWLVLADRPYWLRLVLTWAVAILAFATGVLGNAYANWSPGQRFRINDERELMTILLVLPTISLAVESPLWLLRRLFGWRITRQTNGPTKTRKLAIRDIMLATALVAAALALARVAMQLQRSPGDTSSFWAMLGIAVAIGVGASAILLPPVVWFGLGVNNVRLAVLSAVLHAGVLATIFVTVVAVNGRTFFSTTLWGSLGAAVAAITFALGLSVSFWLARCQGDRLVLHHADHGQRPSQ